MTSATRVSFRAFSNATSGSTRAALATCLAPTTCTDRKRSVAPSRATKQQNTLQGFADTLRSNLSAPDPSNFEPDALLKELKETANLGKRGEVFVLGQFALILLVVFPPLDLHLPLQLLGFLGMGLGGSIIIAGSNSLGKSLTPLPAPRRDAVLVTDGMFAYIRHPLYAGLICGSFGLAALTQDASRAVFAMGLAALLSYKADYEEKQLRDKFGKQYEEYAQEVKRFGLF